MVPLKTKYQRNQRKLAMSSDRLQSVNLLFANMVYYQSVTRQVMSCESIRLRVAKKEDCNLRAIEAVSYCVNNLCGCELT